MYYVYVLRNLQNKSLYIGYSTNIEQRINDHNSGKSKFTSRGEGKWELIYFEAYRNKLDALGREKFLKGGSGRKYLNKQLKNFFSEV